jgi:metal-responsive CopG/Arc/MetJ family transcriptional regulator
MSFPITITVSRELLAQIDEDCKKAMGCSRSRVIRTILERHYAEKNVKAPAIVVGAETEKNLTF